MLSVLDLLQDLRTENEQHDLQRPDVALALVAFRRERVEELAQLLTAVGQLLVLLLLNLGEFFGEVVHPVPDRLHHQTSHQISLKLTKANY